MTDNLFETVEREIMAIHRQISRSRSYSIKSQLSAWFGLRAWDEIMRSCSKGFCLYGLRSDDALTLHGCVLKKDPEAPLEGVTIMLDGVPVRSIDATTCNVTDLMANPALTRKHMVFLQEITCGGRKKKLGHQPFYRTIVIDYDPRIERLVSEDAAVSSDSLEYDSFSLDDFVTAGLVTKTHDEQYMLSHIGSVALHQFRAF